MPVLVVRHAHAGSRKDWEGEDRDRPLNAKGLKQAAALVARLKPFAPVRVLSSPYLRCRQTVEPLAEGLGLKLEEAAQLEEGMGSEALALVRSVAGDSVVLCTHGDVIPDVLVSLADEDRLDLGPAPRQAKGSTWVLEARKGRFVKATYLPSPL